MGGGRRSCGAGHLRKVKGGVGCRLQVALLVPASPFPLQWLSHSSRAERTQHNYSVLSPHMAFGLMLCYTTNINTTNATARLALPACVCVCPCAGVVC